MVTKINSFDFINVEDDFDELHACCRAYIFFLNDTHSATISRQLFVRDHVLGRIRDAVLSLIF